MATNLEQELAQHLIRFKELDQHQSSFRPVDMALARFDRRRFSVIGRPSEATSDAKSLNSVEAFNMVYVQCEPGKGIGLHKHNTAEIFIPMTGMWEVGMGDEGESLVTLGPWDILNVPLNVMHSATNVSNAADRWVWSEVKTVSESASSADSTVRISNAYCATVSPPSRRTLRVTKSIA